MPATTRTGSFPIGFRSPGSAWCKDTAALAAWAKEHDFACVDIKADLDAARTVLDSGLSVGSVDLPGVRQIIHPDVDTRRAAVDAAATLIGDAGELGLKTFFLVLAPGEPDRKRGENFGFMLDGFRELTDGITDPEVRLAIEGWPGPGVLGCTPADLRRLFSEISSQHLAINYDPSHLIRMSIDPIRFLIEFADRVAHVHAKDTHIDSELRYLLGSEQQPTFPEAVAFAGPTWRYTLPGHGSTPWPTVMQHLVTAGYEGFVSIELEDARFHPDEPDQKEGLLLSRRYLEGV